MATDLRTPRPPLTPHGAARWTWQLAKDVIKEYQNDGVGDLAAAITFWTILSVPAAALALVSVLSSLESLLGESLAADVEAEIQQFLRDTFVDSGTLSAAVDELFNESSAGVATVATLVALFTLSRAFAGLIRALDVAYEVDEGRPFWRVRLVAIGLGVGTLVVVAVAATFLALLPELPLGAVTRWLVAPGVFAGLVVWAATVFHLGPYHRTPWRYDVPGAVLTALGWVLATQLFALYVRVSGGANEVQSSVGALLLALTLMYILSVVMVVGAELNDVLSRRAGVVQQPRSMREQAIRLRRRWYQRRRRPHDAPLQEAATVDGARPDDAG